MESLFDLWGKRDPEWEKKYQDTVLIPFTDYGEALWLAYLRMGQQGGTTRTY